MTKQLLDSEATNATIIFYSLSAFSFYFVYFLFSCKPLWRLWRELLKCVRLIEKSPQDAGQTDELDFRLYTPTIKGAEGKPKL